MALFKRFTQNASSNNKEIAQLLKSLEEEIAKIKVEASKMEAAQSRTKRELDECREEIRKMENYIEHARNSGNTESERIFLTKKASLEEKERALQSSYDAMIGNGQNMKQSQEMLLSKMNELKSRKDAIDIKLERAKIQEKLNEINTGTFSELEEKVNRRLDLAEAMAELNEIEKGNL
ncbi:PspA/IM30 family protein [Defluviitalea saccharophila]|jgi:phage shock protein A|uniref:PspA/IM30 family protein n=1 Tax=Defluviitalea saccharophila TaxID=879970 RepID=A0ABZ2Y5U6_9FIRM